MARNNDEMVSITSEMLGLTFKGETVRQVLIEKSFPISQELFMAITLDRAAGLPVLLVSIWGGVDVEESAYESPAGVVRNYIDRATLPLYKAVELWKQAGLKGRVLPTAASYLCRLVRAFWELDALNIEINPLAGYC